MTSHVSCTVSRKLVCHPSTPNGSIRGIEAEVESTTEDKLILSYKLQANLDSLKIPAEQPCRRVDELWRHTCFEAFLMAADGPGYREYNFSPSGEWATYAFSDYRQTADATDEATPVIRVHTDAQGLTLEAEISTALLSPDHPLHLGLSAVAEAVDGSLSYWALRHPPGKPDFHHAEAFDLLLDRPG